MTQPICFLCNKVINSKHSTEGLDSGVVVPRGWVHQNCYINDNPYKGKVDLKSVIKDEGNAVLVMDLVNNIISDVAKDKIVKRYNDVLRARHLRGLDEACSARPIDKSLPKVSQNVVIKLPDISPKRAFPSLNKGNKAKDIKVTFSKEEVLSKLSDRQGIERAINSKDLVPLLVDIHEGTNVPKLERLLRRHIEALRMSGIGVCSDAVHGYFMATSDGELDATCQLLYSRAMKSMAQIAKMKNTQLPDFKSQLNLI